MVGHLLLWDSYSSGTVTPMGQLFPWDSYSHGTVTYHWTVTLIDALTPPSDFQNEFTQYKNYLFHLDPILYTWTGFNMNLNIKRIVTVSSE